MFAFVTLAPELQRFKPNLNASVICNEDLFACFNKRLRKWQEMQQMQYKFPEVLLVKTHNVIGN